jgi:serine/threonine protein phosphatase PrpC
MSFRAACISNRGGRESNQDACDFLMLDDGACWVVADGLGGHRGGAVAAKLAVDTILASFRRNRELSPSALQGHLLAAHNAIVDLQNSSRDLQTMRTTVVVLISDYSSFLSAHAGDSRLYYFQGGRIEYQTRDHSVPQAMADAGDISAAEIRRHQDRNRLLRALGMEQEIRPSVQQGKERLHREDAFLLCVDGFWDHVQESEMEADLAKSGDPGAWLATMESRILRRAEEGHDNYTAIGVFFQNSSAPAPPSRPDRPRRPRRHGDSGRRNGHSGRRNWRARLPAGLARIAGVAAIILAMLTLAAVVTRKYAEVRSTIVVSHQLIKKMTLPRGWVAVTPPGGEIGRPDQQQEYSPVDEPDVRINIQDCVGAAGSRSGGELRAAIGSPEGPVDGRQIESILGSVPGRGCQTPSFRTSNAWTEDLKGKRVLIVEAHCSSPYYRTYSVILPSGDDSSIWAREITYSAPERRYDNHLNAFKQALQTIEWAE